MFVDAFTDMAASPTSIAVTRQSFFFPLVIVVRDYLEDGKKNGVQSFKRLSVISITKNYPPPNFLELWSASVMF
jgi:hypothetical protein